MGQEDQTLSKLSTTRSLETKTSAGSVEERIRRLEDSESIRALWHRYMFLYDTGGQFEKLASLFSDDAILESVGGDNGYRSYNGRGSIVEDFFRITTPARPADDQRVFSGHQGTTFQLSMGVDRAELVGRFFEMTGRGQGTLLAVGGKHQIQLRRESGTWLISRLTIEITYCSQFETVDPRTAFLGTKRK